MDEQTCRVCFQKQDTLFSLFRKRQGLSPYDKLKNKLRIPFTDAGPSSICSQCLVELDIAVNFLAKCEKSNEILASQCNYSRSYEVNDLKNDSSSVCVLQYLEAENEFQCRVHKTVDEDVSEAEIQEKRAEVSHAVSCCQECGSQRRCRHWAPPATHTCPHCHKIFTRKFNYTIHLKRHLGQRDWACPRCGAPQLTRWLARRHCAPRARHACPAPACPKTFTTTTNLNAHIRTHNGERPHVCSECGKSFTSRNTLTDHVRIHTGVKPYICPVCGKQFATNKLAAHLRTHSDARPHACAAPLCARTFRSGRAARLHAATHAAGAARRTHACSVCGARYAHRQSLNKHVRRQHASPRDARHAHNTEQTSEQ